jgi:formylglycine-generating enzyme required for sulfatase activity
MAITRAVIGIALLFFCGPAGAASDTRVALVIGNSAYENAPQLPNPVRDAKAIAEALERLGFGVTHHDNLSAGAMRKALAAFETKAAGADWALVFYAGHGMELDGKNWLIPTDATLAKASDVPDEAVALERVLERVRPARSLRIVILDACRINPFLAKMEMGRGATRAVERGLARIEPQRGEVVFFAARDGHVAGDGEGAHSPFTQAMLNNLEKPGLELGLFFREVTSDVQEATAPAAQEPFVYGSLPRQQYYFKAPEGAQLAAAQPEVTKPQGPQIAEFVPLKLSDVLGSGQKPEPGKPLSALVAEITPPKQPEIVPPEEQVEGIDVCLDGLVVSVAIGAKPCVKPGSGQFFKDCPDCPEMVVVPAGSFVMGSPESEAGHRKDESPLHRVRIARPFAAGRFSMTVGEYMACVKAGGCKPPEWDEKGSRYNIKTGSDDHYKKLGEALTGERYPIAGVSWHDAKAYVKWLSGKTGKSYRLLSEAEFEYAARAGTTTRYWWGDAISKTQANYQGSKPVPVDSFDANPWGLYQVHGNVLNWAEDCWNGNYQNAPSDGSAQTTGDCTSRVLRGGSWFNFPQYLRAAFRYSYGPDDRGRIIGLRVGRTLNP